MGSSIKMHEIGSTFTRFEVPIGILRKCLNLNSALVMSFLVTSWPSVVNFWSMIWNSITQEPSSKFEQNYGTSVFVSSYMYLLTRHFLNKIIVHMIPSNLIFCHFFPFQIWVCEMANFLNCVKSACSFGRVFGACKKCSIGGSGRWMVSTTENLLQIFAYITFIFSV